ncbi:MAG TPA: hypothetical protein VIJ82_10010 [Streptosporangiaceae bacterium]
MSVTNADPAELRLQHYRIGDEVPRGHHRPAGESREQARVLHSTQLAAVGRLDGHFPDRQWRLKKAGDGPGVLLESRNAWWLSLQLGPGGGVCYWHGSRQVQQAV